MPHTLTNTQHQVMVGGLLGDSCLAKDGKYPRLKIDRQAKDRPYLEWQYGIFSELCLSDIKDIERYDKRYDKSYKQVSFRTRAVPAFLSYYETWYVGGARQVPETIELAPLILAVWFADDGCVVTNNSAITLKLSTESFGKAGAEILSSKLQSRFGEKFPIYRKMRDKDQFFIKASTCAAQAFITDIQSHIVEMGMLRKYDTWDGANLTDAPKIGKPSIKTHSS